MRNEDPERGTRIWNEERGSGTRNEDPERGSGTRNEDPERGTRIRNGERNTLITEETIAVRAVGPATLAPHTITQVRVAVPTLRSGGTVMIETGTGPLGLCPVRGVVEVEQDSRIWLANTGPIAIRIEENEVVAMAECVTAGPGTSPGDDRNNGDEVSVSKCLEGSELRYCTACKELLAVVRALKQVLPDFKYLNHHGSNDSDIVAYNLINLLTKCIFCSDSLPPCIFFFFY